MIRIFSTFFGARNISNWLSHARRLPHEHRKNQNGISVKSSRFQSESNAINNFYSSHEIFSRNFPAPFQSVMWHLPLRFFFFCRNHWNQKNHKKCVIKFLLGLLCCSAAVDDGSWISFTCDIENLQQLFFSSVFLLPHVYMWFRISLNFWYEHDECVLSVGQGEPGRQQPNTKFMCFQEMISERRMTSICIRFSFLFYLCLFVKSLIFRP